MTTQQLLHYFERITALYIALSVLGAIASVWISYEVLKAAIKNGINESNLSNRRSAPPTQSPTAPQGYRWVLIKDEKAIDELRVDR